MSEQNRTVAIHVPVLARVEGEGALDLRIEDGNITQLRLRIFEPPRFFEKFLEGRHYSEIPDLVARICGICPVAYQVTAAQALEKLFGVELSPWAQAMRRVFYCGEWIQSHSLHIHLLAAPDFFGCGNAIELAKIAPDEVRRGLRIQALGNELMDLFGARSVHPVGVRIGGFHAAPALSRIRDLRDKLRAALPEAEALVRWAARIPMPPDDQAFVSVAMRHPTAYAIETGAIAASDGLLIEADAYDAHFAEQHEPHSTALFSTYHQQPYLVGPLARLNLNHDRLPVSIQTLLAETGFTLPSRNLFHSLLARAVEILLALQEAARLLDDYTLPDSPWAPVTPRAGVATGCTEAPRGLLWHRYEMDADGRVVNARIVPPTSQNQGRIEQDLRLSLLNFGLDHPDDALRLHCEKVIRNYDPCISCATHFLRLNVERT
ncbi:Ni/Fe hydrogenase subunit alpha [Thiobacillus sp.]|uniref:Ni/Fe hydrogenase subunit alpha n=1 Tax=Thiobacillus sp. TaxID=924 RepID=UPI0025E5C611|nr:Ni/Fe hydrogenase subunit alpha [Thiobacillus sp.]MBT9540462.1 Ni/Fe hydrogenase subunit alpha [Thiobacillus sp.]